MLPVAAYLVWNVGFVVWLARRVASDGGLVVRTLRIVGLAAAVRLVWLVPVARDPWWAGWPLSVLVVLTVATVALVHEGSGQRPFHVPSPHSVPVSRYSCAEPWCRDLDRDPDVATDVMP